MPFRAAVTVTDRVLVLAPARVVSTHSPALFLYCHWYFSPVPVAFTVNLAVVPMLWSVFLPFNAIKGGLNAAVTLLLYKPLVKALRAAKLLPAQASERQKSVTLANLLIAAVIAGVCIAVLLVLRRG